MFHSRIVQLIALAIMVLSLGGAGFVLPSMIEESEAHTLRYTNVWVESATPEVAIGDAIGALKGVIVDVLWIRAGIMKEKGLYYEANTLAELITRLQPRFAGVWAFQGHNMAYNISVATHTEEERWTWVKKGIDLIRLRGLRHNPNNVELYKELAYYFAHKIEGVADDAHLYYKREFCKEWHNLLGPPPFDWNERIAWIEKVADAPETLEDAEKRTPGVIALYETLRAEMDPFQRFFTEGFDREIPIAWQFWWSVKNSWYGRTLQLEDQMRTLAGNDSNMTASFFVTLDRLASDPEKEQAWETLLAYLRKKVLREHYNMDARFMYELTRDWGPIDWRHGSAHSFYWAMMGAQRAESRYRNRDDEYKIINNDRLAATAMQDLFRYGAITFDPFSNDIPSRLPDPRWIDPVEKFFEHLYQKHIDVPGWGSDSFIAWHTNFLSDAVRQLYRMGYHERAQQILDRLDSLYGMGHVPPNPEYSIPIEDFVIKEAFEEYSMQPHVATTDVQNALYYGIRMGLARGDEAVYENSKKFADQVLTYFKTNAWNDFVNKFGEQRIGGIVSDLESIETSVFLRIMMDTQIPLDERLRIYNLHTPANVQRQIYDFIREPLRAQVAGSALQGFRFEDLLPEPPGMAEYRQQRLQMEEEARRRNAPGTTGRPGIE